MESESENSQFGCSQIADVSFATREDMDGLDLRNCVLLDNQSTVHAFCNPNMVSDIQESGRVMSLSTNGGKIRTSQTCKVKDLPQRVWFHPQYITNILSYDKLSKLYRIKSDSKLGVFTVFRPGRSNLHFRRNSSGLHLIKVDDSRNVSLVNTVQRKLVNFSARQVKDSIRARELMAMVGYPSPIDFKVMVDMGFFHNCPVTVTDIRNSDAIFGPTFPALNGKTTIESSASWLVMLWIIHRMCIGCTTLTKIECY